MVDCDFCGHKIMEMPRSCKYCGCYFCTKHRLPENHKCAGLESLKREGSRRFQSTIQNLASEHAKVNDRGYEDIVDAPSRTPHPSFQPSVRRDKYRVDKKYRREYVGSATQTTQRHTESSDTIKIRIPKIKFTKKTLIALPILILILLGLIIYATLAVERVAILENSTKTRTEYYNETISNKISFAKYTNSPSEWDGQEVVLMGSLKRYIKGSDGNGVYTEAIVDDYGNTIDIKGLTSEFKSMFPHLGSTTKVYNLTGTFRRRYPSLEIVFSDYVEAERPVAGQVEKQRMVDYIETTERIETKPKYPSVKNWVYTLIGKEITCDDGTVIKQCSTKKPYYCSYSGLIRNPPVCGCPTGERVYKSECIKEIKCTDGTFSPECSKNQPKQCENGKLVDNPVLCGCPKDYKLKEDMCVNIKCSDGTLEPDCSAKFKMQCIEGKFVYNPLKCGCPEGYVKRINTCLKTCDDGTAYGECSSDKPYYCNDGRLIEKASKCGCDYGDEVTGETCLPIERSIEQYILLYTNEEREDEGLSALKWDDLLGEIARDHSQDMADNDFFSHTNLDGESPSDRAARHGFSRIKQLGGGYYTIGIAENIGKMPTGNVEGVGYVSNDAKSVARAEVDSWMDSPGHRANILNSQYTHLGVGVAYDGLYYVCTQNFW